MTTFRSGHITKVMLADIETYRKLINCLGKILLNISHYTYQLKHERVVLRGIHALEDITTIKEYINKLGYKVKNIVNIRTHKLKTPYLCTS